MTPHEALKAAVEERMRLAKEATGERWWSNGGQEVRTLPADSPGAVEPFGYLVARPPVALFDAPPQIDYETRRRREWADFAHIAANDPAFVIRQCERDLKVLERHAPEEVRHRPGQEVRFIDCSSCFIEGEDYDDYGGPADYPCIEIRDLAEVYQINLGVSDES